MNSRRSMWGEWRRRVAASEQSARAGHGPPKPRRAVPCPRGGLGLPQLIGGDGALRKTRITEADLDFGYSVASNARAHGERPAAKDELEMGDFQPLGRKRDLAVRGNASRANLLAERTRNVGG